MKKIKWLLILFISVFAFNRNVWAASVTLSTSSKNVKVGDKFTVYANMKSSAAWNIHVKASGPVSGCVINQADASADANDLSKTFSATCTATGEGTITITMSGDVTSASDGNAVNIAGTTTVTVTKKTTTSNSNTNKPSNSNTNNNLSKNNNLKELSVEGQTLHKEDNNHYTLTVANNVTNINIKAVAEDDKAKVTGIGKKDLKVGENHFEIVVTSESGVQNKIDIKVTRRENFTIEDLDSLLNDSKKEEINITISKDTSITNDIIQKIKDKKKKVNFNYYDENKKLQYTWIIDGSRIKDITEVDTFISFEPTNKKEIEKASNYANGLYIELNQKGAYPEGTKVKLYVGNQFEEGYVLKLYQYEQNKMTSVREDLNVKDGYIEFDAEKGADYFVTMSSIENAGEKEVNKEPVKLNIFMIISIVELIVIIILLILVIKKNKNKNDKSDDEVKPDSLEESDIPEKNTIESLFPADGDEN